MELPQVKENQTFNSQYILKIPWTMISRLVEKFFSKPSLSFFSLFNVVLEVTHNSTFSYSSRYNRKCTHLFTSPTVKNKSSLLLA